MAQEAQSFLAYFGLREQPFAATADPVYFYATPSHKECLFRLWSSIDDRHGIAVVLGHYGTGKTTLLRKLLSGMRATRDRYNTAVIGSPIPSWTSFALLESIVTQFGLRPSERSFKDYMEALNQYLLANRDRINTLIIDDAQNLNKRGQLELLRLAQNLETPQHKLLNLVLFAQLEWMTVLRAAPNFLQRVNMAYTLDPLGLEDTRKLIDFRLRQAGAGPDAVRFDEGAVEAVYAHAEGSPRVTVTLCRNVLLLAAQLRTRRINEQLVRHTIRKTTLPGEYPEPAPQKAAPAAGSQERPAPPPAAEQERPAPTRAVAHEPPAQQAGLSREERANALLLRAARGRGQGS